MLSAMKALPSLDQVAVAKLRMRHTARSPSSSYPTESGARGAVPGCTWYFRLLLKGTIAGVMVDTRSLGETSDSRGP